MEEALVKAVEERKIKKAKVLLKKKISPNIASHIDGWTPLMIAAGHGDAEMVNLLIKYKANVNAKNKAGETALLIASWPANEAVMEALIDAGAKVDVQDEAGWTPLMWVVVHWPLNEQAMDLLIDAGADINKKNSDGLSAKEIGRVNGLELK